MFWNSRFMPGKGQKEKPTKGGGDPDYEEVGPQRNKEAQNDNKTSENCAHCDLCGSSDAAVRCDKCNCQAFCTACDETYHGHPKRASHTRKALNDDINRVRPPLPPKVPDGPVTSPPPQPPPRKNKKGLILSSTLGVKDQGENDSGLTLLGSLKKIMGNRPLPPPPDQLFDKRRNSTPNFKSTNSMSGSSPALNHDSDAVPSGIALPQSIMEINSRALTRKPPSSMPPTPPSAMHAQYPKLQPKSPPVPGRKLSLQQFPSNFEDKRASLLDGNSAPNNSWDKPSQQQQQPPTTQKLRSQSVSDEQWNQMLVIHGSNPPQGYTGSTATSEVGGVSLPRRAYNTMGNVRSFGRGMVSSASVCDLNTLNQQQLHHQQHQQQQQQQQQQQPLHPHGYPNIHSANSFQQLSVMSYDPNMVWVQPPSCALCQAPHMYPQPVGSGGMKRTTSNISMNLSSVGSDVSGFPWPHVHHHMPMGYPGYYPPGCHPHVHPGYGQGSAMSIPDSMKSFNRIPSSPAPSVRSSSHRSNKSSKSRSFSATEAGRKSRNHSRKRSEETEESESSSLSDEQNLPISTPKSNKSNGLAWQCDHCTFINPGHVQACGMCSKVPVKNNGRLSRRGNDRRKSDKRRDQRTDSGENLHNLSDYDNDQRKETKRDNRLKSSASVKSSSGRSKKKSRRRKSSQSQSSSGSGSDDEDEEVQLEKHLRDLRLTSRSRTGEYDGYSVTSRTREKEREKGSLKKEGGGSRYRNRRRYHSDRSMTPARNSPSRRSRRGSSDSEERSPADKKSSDDDLDQIVHHDNKSSHEGTLIGTTASESNTLKLGTSKENTGSLKHRKTNKTLNTKKSFSHSEGSENSKSSELQDPFDSPPRETQEPPSDKNVTVIPDVQIFEVLKENEKEIEDKITKDVEDYQALKNQHIKEKIYEQPDDKLYQEGHLALSIAKDVEEPSFANTLDGIETLGTNEVADYDPSSQALEYKIDDFEQITRDLDVLMPEATYIQRKTPENNNPEYDLYEKSSPEEENIKEDLIIQTNTKNEQNSNQIQSKKDEETLQTVKQATLQTVQDPSYEVIDNPDKPGKELTKNVAAAERIIETKSKETVKVKDSESEPEENIINEENNDIYDDDHKDSIKVKEESSEEVLESTSSENSNEVHSLRRDRQHTPLSISSSDAQFYSPPNSPDLSSNEKRRRKRVMNDNQIYDEDDSIEEDLTKPSTVTVTDLPAAEEVGDGYDNVAFQDARTHADTIPLVRPSSDQALSARNQQEEEEKGEEKKRLLRVSKEKNKLRNVIVSDEEDEVDERFLTVEQIIKRRKQKAMKEQGLQLVQILREAEEMGYNPEEVSVAITLCEKNKSPVEWLQENWRHMVDTVMTLVSNYGLERKVNDIGEISSTEAKKALRIHKGNIWAAVTDVVEERQKKYNEIDSRGNFKREEIIKTLTDFEGDSDKAFLELNKTHQLGSFFSKIWGGFMESMPKVMAEKPKSSQPLEEEKLEKYVQVSEKKEISKEVKKERKTHKKKETQEKIQESIVAPTAFPTVQSPSQTDEETENQIYENFVNPLLEKLGKSLPKREEGVPLISEELKRKIVQAILEGDNETSNENVVFDSDEDSPGTLSEEDKEDNEVDEEGPILTEGVQSEFEYFDEFKSVDNASTDEEDEKSDDQSEDIQFIREEDVKNDPEKITVEKKKLEPTESAKPDTDTIVSPPVIDADEAAKIRSRSGPVTVQKATQIVGMAIAKAMARESSVRRDSVSSESSSQLGTPTPASTPESEELPEIVPSVTADSDEEMLGSLDTIPEEEEFSERTESGRVVSRSSQSSKLINQPRSAETIVSQKAKAEPTKTAALPASAKAISIPPAVASYSGPIFIPTSLAASNSSSDHNTGQTLSNEPPKVVNSKNHDERSSHYQSIRTTKKDANDKLQTDIKRNTIAPLTTPSNNDGPLTTEKRAKPSIKEDKEIISKSSNEAKIQEKEIVRAHSLENVSKKSSGKEETTKNKISNTHSTRKLVDTSSNKVSKLKKVFNATIPTSNQKTNEFSNDSTLKTESGKILSETNLTAKKPPTVPKKKTQMKGRSIIDSSGESEEEDEQEHLGIDRVEGLKNTKGRLPDDQEVQELKEQIQMMRKELESKIDSNEEEDSNVSETLKEGFDSPAGPIIVLQEPIEEEDREVEEKNKKDEEEEETTQGVTDEDIQQYEQLKFDRTVRRLLAEGQATSYEKAELAAQLLNLSFDETDSIQAAEGCSSIYTALQFLQQECELCAEKHPVGRMVSMLQCIHRCCYQCANTYFSFQIKAKNIRELRCPFCDEPDLDASEEIAAEYLNNLDILLKNILDQETHELFQRKLRDWTLMKDPNFRWCNKCSSGFIANPRARKLICPDCKDVTCAQCRKQWEAQHTGITCEAFAKWKEENDPEIQAESVAKHLAENGITCPSCKFTYALAKGGCMHFTCTECKYEFCSGCSQPFKQGAKCHVGPYCERLGLHAHHPRNCLFYLRDKEPGQLQQLLKEHNVEYDTEDPTECENSKKVCRVQEQKETLEGLRDDICGRVTQDGNAGLCRLHYIEYLVEKINNHGLDPVSIFDEADLRVCLRRNGKTVPVRRWESEKLYRDKLIKLIKEQLPLS